MASLTRAAGCCAVSVTGGARVSAPERSAAMLMRRARAPLVCTNAQLESTCSCCHRSSARSIAGWRQRAHNARVVGASACGLPRRATAVSERAHQQYRDRGSSASNTDGGIISALTRKQTQRLTRAQGKAPLTIGFVGMAAARKGVGARKRAYVRACKGAFSTRALLIPNAGARSRQYEIVHTRTPARMLPLGITTACFRRSRGRQQVIDAPLARLCMHVPCMCMCRRRMVYVDSVRVTRNLPAHCGANLARKWRRKACQAVAAKACLRPRRGCANLAPRAPRRRTTIRAKSKFPQKSMCGWRQFGCQKTVSILVSKKRQ